MKSYFASLLGQAKSTPKSFLMRAILWIGSVSLTCTAINAVSDFTSIPFVILVVGWLVLTGSFTSTEGRTYQLLKGDYPKVVSWICILIGTAYVLFGQASILMDIVTVAYWVAMYMRHIHRRFIQSA